MKKMVMMNQKMNEKICSICKEPYFGHGNLALPINKGYCCDTCNKEVVLPVRWNDFYGGE